MNAGVVKSNYKKSELDKAIKEYKGNFLADRAEAAGLGARQRDARFHAGPVVHWHGFCLGPTREIRWLRLYLIY